MRKKGVALYAKALLIILVVAATFVLFGYYISQHPEIINSLFELNIATLFLLAVGYSFFTLINAWVLFHSLRFVGKKVPLFENIVLTGYSSIVNFFGPLQSGPGVRAVYLKKRHHVKLRDFFVATLIFYGFFAAINTLVLLVAGAIKFQSTSTYYLLLAGGTVFALIIFYFVATRITRIKSALHTIKSRLNDKDFWLIGAGALALTLTTALTYFVEINHVNSTVTFLQALVYTAAANLALFVSLTPGAIGIRESFLVISQQLHGIDTATIVGASIIDRAFYVAFLLILFIVLLLINSRTHLLNTKRGKR